MLDSDTKRRIDTCRDILVGKVPDPKSQVEQITIALIYKFMDDMDAEAEELGGDRNFFTGEFARYGWSKLMAPGLGGHEMLSLYAEAIQRMNENPGIPALFRDIFKNAFLPYRDPETLRSFLKEINTFTYDHSERLGDAFEYLLSVLGSQGEAGQFRTPRHIIDFMVEIIDPKKDETILDPACGTAGFLISAYKHILKHNSTGYREQQDREAYDEKGVPMEALTLESPLRYSGDLLTPDDRKRLAANIGGYDISPDMVRLSLVNMYLHGFIDPHIEEYDTLTSDEKWPELADVILANPPFMSPKGGIRPHNRFAVQSKRSEVLFVDYIAEHLTPNGRAAVVVPEGIIFQSQTAYRQLREMLVKNYLVAVISLPAGVFNPYSGVKTSILVMDKRLTKQRNEVLFVKIENDGFNLGAQRRPIEKNDLPEAVRIVKAFLQLGEVAEHRNVLAVSREQIGENGEWNLSGDRHLETGQKVSDYEFVQIGDIATILNGYAFRSANYVDSGIRVIRITNVQKGSIEDSDPKFYPIESDEPVEKYRLFEGDLLVSLTGNVGRVGLLPNSLLPAALNQRVACIRPDEQKVLKNYLYYLLNQDQFERECIDSSSGVAQKNLSTKWLSEYEIPLPPQEVQKEIVAEIEGYQKIIDGARQVVENYQPRIPIHPDWPMEKIGGLVKINNGQVLTEFSGEENIACIKVGDMNLPENSVEIITSSHWLSATERPLLPVGSIVFPKRGAAIATNKKRFTRIPCLIDNNCMGLTVQDESKLAPKYLFYFLVGFDLSTISNSAGIALINNGDISGVDIPLPDIDIQKAIVTEIEAEQSLMDANKELIQRFEDKIKQTINRVWGEAE